MKIKKTFSFRGFCFGPRYGRRLQTSTRAYKLAIGARHVLPPPVANPGSTDATAVVRTIVRRIKYMLTVFIHATI